MLVRGTKALIVFFLIGLTACAGPQRAPSEADPWEGFNRSIYNFNDSVDRLILKPVAETYRDVTPQFIRTGIGNFLSNLGDILVIINDIFQLKIEQAAADASRFFLNTTLGIFGLFDVATPIGLEKHDEDFGQTLGYWGLDSGPYLVLPLLGPSTVRDTGGLVVDYSLNPVRDELDNDEQLALTIVQTVDTRARLLDAEGVLDAAAFDDRYAFIRDAWLARRENKVRDGEPDDDGGPDELDELDALDD